MHQTLKLHPACRCEAVTGIEAEAERPGPGRLIFRFRVTGKIGDVLWPLRVPSARTDALWQHTCFEAFLRAPPDERYLEFNFAPSTEWAAYSFDGYRDGMRIPGGLDAPGIVTRLGEREFGLEAALDWDGLPEGRAWRLGLSAVIEETNGRRSYWALAHGGAKPDFHHADAFALELPAQPQQS
jgi:hypothetical protein